MTNPRLTDLEVFEFRFPVWLESCAICVSSGINRVVRTDGRVEELGHIGQAETAVGDVFEVHKQGGSGFGTP